MLFGAVSKIGAFVNLELARQHWEDGRRRVERVRLDPVAYARLVAQSELIAAALRSRIGQNFTLEQLAAAYDGAEEWARELLDDARDEDAPPPDTATAADAAFHLYARSASDYAP